eukprot:TRINITY_DN1260_c0_g1_i17.p1 TRINITY_DN1260_c0_g1~~TRINITY_DN1260_c0_g1_i17.p1  ORF type:complete len:438 (-),score=32.05 TRINITY_DN1260_c0_g1_i17:140-1453(-)
MGCTCSVTEGKRRIHFPLSARRKDTSETLSPLKATHDSCDEVLSTDKPANNLRKWEPILKKHSTKNNENNDKDNTLMFVLLNPRLFSKKLSAGPPSEFRWASWKAALNVSHFFVPDKYERLKANKGKSKWLDMIMQDVARTFPRCLHNKEALENILAAYSIYNETVGYCQGMGYIAGLLFLVSESREEETFWTFVAFMEQRVSFDRLPLCGLNKLFLPNFPMVRLFEELLAKLLDKDLKRYLDDMGLPIELWFHKWISTLFLYSFPIQHCIRFWDVLMSGGVSCSLSLACAILSKLGPKLYQAQTTEKCNEILKIPPQILSELLADPEDIISTAKSIRINWKSLNRIVQKHASCIGRQVNTKILNDTRKSASEKVEIERANKKRTSVDSGVCDKSFEGRENCLKECAKFINSDCCFTNRIFISLLLVDNLNSYNPYN